MPPQNQVMPDSEYDIDRKGPGLIWETTKAFHHELKYAVIAEAITRTGDADDAINHVNENDFHKAQDQVIQNMGERKHRRLLANFEDTAQNRVWRESQNYYDELRQKAENKAEEKGQVEVKLDNVQWALAKRLGRKELQIILGGAGVGALVNELLEYIDTGGTFPLVFLLIGIIGALLVERGVRA